MQYKPSAGSRHYLLFYRQPTQYFFDNIFKHHQISLDALVNDKHNRHFPPLSPEISDLSIHLSTNFPTKINLYACNIARGIQIFDSPEIKTIPTCKKFPPFEQKNYLNLLSVLFKNLKYKIQTATLAPSRKSLIVIWKNI